MRSTELDGTKFLLRARQTPLYNVCICYGHVSCAPIYRLQSISLSLYVVCCLCIYETVVCICSPSLLLLCVLRSYNVLIQGSIHNGKSLACIDTRPKSPWVDMARAGEEEIPVLYT
jgi:hypothetical protein